MNDNSSSARLRERAERHLGQFAITIEVTLISVMVGVVIFPLMDFAAPLLRDLKFEYWLYILCGAFIVIDVWAEVIVHTLSLVGWPLDIIRNALYIGVAIVIAILMHFLGDPRSWFVLSIPVGLFVVAIAWYDARIIEKKRRAARTSSTQSLFNALAQRQRRTLWQSLAFILLVFAAAALAIFVPAFFIEQRGHLLFIALQLSGVIVILTRTIGDFITWSEPILQVAMEELKEE